MKKDMQTEKDSYRYRLKELQDRSRGKELERLAKELLDERADAMQQALFVEIQQEKQHRVGEIEEQVAVLRQNVERTRILLEREQERRITDLLPRRFRLREVRVLPLALTYLVPAQPEDKQP